MLRIIMNHSLTGLLAPTRHYVARLNMDYFICRPQAHVSSPKKPGAPLMSTSPGRSGPVKRFPPRLGCLLLQGRINDGTKFSAIFFDVTIYLTHTSSHDGG